MWEKDIENIGNVKKEKCTRIAIILVLCKRKFPHIIGTFASFHFLSKKYMISFKRIYELIFKSFRIRSASHFLDELSKEKIHAMIIIKRSWIYGFFVSLIFLLILIVLLINIYFISIHYTSLIILYILMGWISYCIILGVYTSIRYLYQFRKLHRRDGALTGIHDIELIKTTIKEEEEAFISFFNQITTSYILMILMVICNIYYISYLDPKPFDMITFGEIFFFLVQIALIHYYRKYMIDLEMDYVIIIPNRVYFIDQIAIYKRNETIKWVSNIRVISSTYQWILGSIFDYGTIEIMIKWDTPALVMTYHMRFVDQPIAIVNQINLLIEPQQFEE